MVPNDDATRVAAFVDDIHFGASRNGESLARVPNGSGFVGPAIPSLGSENDSPRIPNVLISEVNYHPGAPSSDSAADIL